MRSTRKKHQKKTNKLLYIFLSLFIIVCGIGIFFVTSSMNKQTPEISDDTTEITDEVIDEKADIDENNDAAEQEPEIETFTEVRLAAAGDIMFHSTQNNSAKKSDGSYDFTPMFADVKPFLSAADITVANFETTLGGPESGYTGYPLFNSPDETADAILNAGVDILTTANNHSLDSRDTGLKRTVTVLQEKGIDTVGTYAEKPTSRVLVYEENDITFGFISYTESTNGLGAQYPEDELNNMINLM